MRGHSRSPPWNCGVRAHQQSKKHPAHPLSLHNRHSVELGCPLVPDAPSCALPSQVQGIGPTPRYRYRHSECARLCLTCARVFGVCECVTVYVCERVCVCALECLHACVSNPPHRGPSALFTLSQMSGAWIEVSAYAGGVPGSAGSAVVRPGTPRLGLGWRPPERSSAATAWPRGQHPALAEGVTGTEKGVCPRIPCGAEVGADSWGADLDCPGGGQPKAPLTVSPWRSARRGPH